MPTDGPSDRIYSYLCLRFRYFARQNADKFTLHAAFSAPLQEDSFTMKAGLQQIPIQGAAPRLAGNREWDGLPMPTRFWAILAVAFGVSLSVIDGAIANVALPTMARMLGISSANSIWIVNAYQLAIVVSLLSFSALGDVIGYRKIYIGGLGIFIVASLGCTLSDSLATLVTARVCQGFGAAAITSVNTTLIRLIYPRRHLGRGMGVNATVVAVSSVAGPTLASGILSIATWPWLFAINIPIGLIACLLSYRFLPKNPVRIRGRHFDWRDGLMNALTFGLLIASIEGYSHGLKPSYIGISVILLVVIACIALVVCFLTDPVDSKTEEPADTIVSNTENTPDSADTTLEESSQPTVPSEPEQPTEQDVLKGALSAAEEADTSILDELISNAVLDHYADAVQPGQLHVESHVTLAEDKHDTQSVTVYLLVLQEIYSVDGESLTLENGSYIPTAITFSLSTSGGAPIEYWEPSDGSYSDDIRAKFPSAAADEALQNDQAYIEDLKTVCYQKALEAKNGAAS